MPDRLQCTKVVLDFNGLRYNFFAIYSPGSYALRPEKLDAFLINEIDEILDQLEKNLEKRSVEQEDPFSIFDRKIQIKITVGGSELMVSITAAARNDSW